MGRPAGIEAGGLSGGANPITDIAEGSVGAFGGRGFCPNLPMRPPPRGLLSLAIYITLADECVARPSDNVDAPFWSLAGSFPAHHVASFSLLPDVCL